VFSWKTGNCLGDPKLLNGRVLPKERNPDLTSLCRFILKQLLYKHLCSAAHSRPTLTRDSPREDDHEVHCIPAVAEVRAFVEREAQGDDLNGRLETEYSNEVGLRVVLQGDGDGMRETEEQIFSFYFGPRGKKRVVNEASSEREREREGGGG